MNVHTPERGANESRSDYIARRKLGHSIVAANNPQGGNQTSRQIFRADRKRNRRAAKEAAAKAERTAARRALRGWA